MKNIQDKREREIVKAGLFGVLLNLGLAITKGAVGVLTGSVAIMLDAVNNLTDILSAMVTIVGAKLAGKEADKEHPFGHGRVEYLAAVGVGIIILFAGVGALIEAIPEIFNATVIDYSATTILLLMVAILAKVGFGVYAKKKGREVKSRSLEATGVDAMCDAALTFGTLVAAAAAILFKVSLEGIIGVIIAIFIIRTSIEILGEGWVEVIGRRVDEKLARKIKRKIIRFPEVKEVRSLVLHNYGPTKVIGAAKIRVSSEMKVKELEELTEKIEEEVFEEEQVRLMIGV